MPKIWSDLETTPFVTPWRRALVSGLVDGDTYDLLIDLGFDVCVRARIRLLSENAILTIAKSDDVVDTWEKSGLEKDRGLLALSRVEELIPEGSEVRIWSSKSGSRGKYGRWLCVVLFKKDGHWLSIGDLLIEEGHASDTL